MSTTTHPTGYPATAHRGPVEGLMHDWPFVAPAMMAILPSAAVIVALMFFAERYFPG